MHDTQLIEKIYQAVVALCRESGITKVNELEIEVDEGCHTNEEHLLSHLSERDSMMFGDWTIVHVEYRPFEKLTAIIKSIDGDSCE